MCVCGNRVEMGNSIERHFKWYGTPPRFRHRLMAQPPIQYELISNDPGYEVCVQILCVTQ